MTVYLNAPIDFSPSVEVAASYVNVLGKILFLQLSSRKPEAGAWGVPAGKLETNEKPQSGAKRELFEETGIFIDSESSFCPLGKLYIRKPAVDYIYHLFGIELDSEPSIKLSNEHIDYKWALRSEVENMPLMAGAHLALDTYFQNFSLKNYMVRFMAQQPPQPFNIP